MTLTIPDDKWQEIKMELNSWLIKNSATLKDTQRLAGLLNFACRCVRSGRVYLSRILNFLRTLPKFGSRKITQEVKQDIGWWLEFAEHFNGVSLIQGNQEWSSPDHMFSSDSCLTGGGGRVHGRKLLSLEISNKSVKTRVGYQSVRVFKRGDVFEIVGKRM